MTSLYFDEQSCLPLLRFDCLTFRIVYEIEPEILEEDNKILTGQVPQQSGHSDDSHPDLRDGHDLQASESSVNASDAPGNLYELHFIETHLPCRRGDQDS